MITRIYLLIISFWIIFWLQLGGFSVCGEKDISRLTKEKEKEKRNMIKSDEDDKIKNKRKCILCKLIESHFRKWENEKQTKQKTDTS